MREINFKVALFDLDGVVFDTESQYTIFWGGQCRKYHPEIPGLEHTIKGQTLVQIFDKYFADVKSEQPLIVKQLHDFERNMDYRYIAGLTDYISHIKLLGVKTAIVTSSNKDKMEAVSKVHPELNDYFDAIFTSEDFERSKPDPDCYLKGASYFGVDSADCVVFEDSFNGLKAGRAANMRVVGLATTNAAADIKPYADIVINDFTELKDLV